MAFILGCKTGSLPYSYDADNIKRLLYVPPHKRARFKLMFYMGLIRAFKMWDSNVIRLFVSRVVYVYFIARVFM